jgi:hypothetical protein
MNSNANDLSFLKGTTMNKDGTVVFDVETGNEVYIRFKRTMNSVYDEKYMKYCFGSYAGITGVKGKIVKENKTHFYLETLPISVSTDSKEITMLPVGHEINKNQILEIIVNDRIVQPRIA